MKENLYKRLPPLERRPDGTLYRMTPAQRKQANALIRQECCCYEDGNCMLLDGGDAHTCPQTITSELEAVVYQQMVKKLASYKTLTGRKKAAKANPKIAALQVELVHVDGEIEKLVDSLTGANNVLLSYVNVKIAELDGRKQELLARIAELTVEAISPEQVS